MEWFEIVAVVALAICAASCTHHVVRLVRLGRPVDHAAPAGDAAGAVIYSFTGAMNPARKESASLHLPAYGLGVVFHVGTFAAILLFFVALSGARLPRALEIAAALLLAGTALAGLILLVKRWAEPRTRALSSLDDYVSNALVTLFQLSAGGLLVSGELRAFHFLVAAALWLYLPLGKLRHAIYFFAARYHLGMFYGSRGTWPPQPAGRRRSHDRG